MLFVAGGDGEIRKAFEDAAESVGKSLGTDASNALRQLYQKTKGNLQKISRDAKAGDEKSANDIKAILAQMKENANRVGGDVDKSGAKAAQMGLYGKFKDILSPSAEAEKDAEGKVFSDVLEPPEGKDGVPWVGGSKTDGVKLGQLPEDAVKRDGDLITHVTVDGKDVPVDDYMKGLADERLKMYQGAKEAGTFTKNDTGAAMAVGIDRRTGAVYEGVNGDSAQVIPAADRHQTLSDRVQDMKDNKGEDGYTWRDESTGHDTKGDDDPFGHAEVKAANGMLNERQAAGVESGDSAIGEMSFAPLFPWTKSSPARTCPNCSHLLDGASLPYGMRRSYGD